MRIYIYKTAKKRIEKAEVAGERVWPFNDEGDMDYLLGTEQEVLRVDDDGTYRIDSAGLYPVDWFVSPCACRVVKEKE